MIVVADSSVILDFFDGLIENPYELIQPYRILLISPVVLHEVLRAYPLEEHSSLIKRLRRELLPAPSLEHWVECAQILRSLYPKRQKQTVARMQNDILIALSARDIKAPVWSRDSDFKMVCEHIGSALISA